MKKAIVEVTDDLSTDEFRELVENIEKISNLGKKLKASRLTERAIILLIWDITGLSKGAIRNVLDALPRLEERFLKTKKKSKG